MKRTHATPLRPDDRVKWRYATIKGTAPLEGRFIAYCPGYLSHCFVQWDGQDRPSRVKADKVALISGGPWGSTEDRKDV